MTSEVAEDEAVGPVLLVVVEVDEVFELDAVEVGEEGGLLGRVLLDSARTSSMMTCG